MKINLNVCALPRGKHLLTGNALFLNVYSREDSYEANISDMRNRVKYLRTLIGHFQKRWTHEYPTEMREFQKCGNKLPAKQLEVGDVL